MRNRLAALAALFVLGAPLYAQLNGRITGTVVDQSGAAVPGASVNLYLAGGASAVLTSSTSSDGIFAFSAVRPDNYDLEVVAPGFAKFINRGVKVDPTRETPLGNIALEVQSTQQTVEVSAVNQTVQVANAEVSTTVTQKQIQNLPVLDRQVSSLFLTQAGVSNSRGATVINGMHTSFANVTLDGINIQDNFIRTNSLDYIPNKTTIEQVGELSITTANANSSMGGGGAQIAISTPSGSNTYHGSLYWYNRNSALAANDWFNNKSGVARPFLNQNQVGGSAGGRIIRDKLFFYTNYEAFRNRQQSPVSTTILTPEARNGIFKYRVNGNVQSVNLLGLRNTTIDPVIADLLKQVPTAGNSSDIGDGLNTTGYRFNARANEDRNVFLYKGDYYLTQRHSFTGTYSYNSDKVDRPDLGTFFTTVPPAFNDNHAHLMSLAWRWTITPTFTNEVRGGFNLSPGIFGVSNEYPKYFVTGLPFTNPLNTFLAQGRATDTYSIQDNASWVKGKHTVYFGYQSQMIRTVPYNDGGIIPSYGLGFSTANQTGLTAAEVPGINGTDLNTANGMLAALAGIVGSSSQSFNVTSRTSGFVSGATNLRHFRYDTYAGYVTDTWKVMPRLTLNLGLRYDYWGQLDEADSLFLGPVLQNNNVVQTVLNPNTTLDFIGGSAGRNFYKPDRNNFAPNFGFAYDVFGNGKTAVRGAYSISYVNDDTITTIRNSITTNSGLSSSVTRSGLAGKLTGNLPAIATPAYKVPRTLADNYALDSTSAVGIPDPNLVTPYVQQYNFGIQQEVKGAVVEVRYVGNHLVKGLRGFDYNQVNVNAGGFLDDFKRAQSNAFLSQAAGRGFVAGYNPAIAGSQQLTVFPKMPSGGLLTNSTILASLRSGEPGTLAQTYQTNGLNGDINFFANPNILGGNVISNYTNSSYNSLQVDVRKRTSSGIQVQGNYTFSKVLSDAAGTDQTRFEPFLDINNPGIERSPAPFDLRHAIKGNYSIDLPFGKNKKYSFNNRVLNAALGGWTTSGIITRQSGSPYSVLSARGTLNRGSRSANNTVIAVGDLDNVVGFYMTGNGPYFINPSALNPADKRGVAADGTTPFAGQVFFNPPAGTLGSLQRRTFYGPWVFSFDAAMLKTFHITERQTVQFRADAINLPNHQSFYAGADGTNHNVNSTTFGRILSPQYSARVMQFGLYYRF